MDVIILQAFVSVLLVLSMLLLFAYMLRQKTLEHTERLALLPLDEPEVSKEVRS